MLTIIIEIIVFNDEKSVKMLVADCHAACTPIPDSKAKAPHDIKRM